MMHRKEYYLIANALAKCKSVGEDTLIYVTDMLAVPMAKEDPTFKRDLFFKTVGVKDPDASPSEN